MDRNANQKIRQESSREADEDEWVENDLSDTNPKKYANEEQDASTTDAFKMPTSRPARIAASMARNPWTYFAVAWFVTLLLSVVGLIVGKFEVAADNAGWNSRGTLIANRETQLEIVLTFSDQLLQSNNNEAVWKNLQNNVQPGWESDDDSADNRRLSRTDVESPYTDQSTPRWISETNAVANAVFAPIRMHHLNDRHLQDVVPGLEGCDTSWCVVSRPSQTAKHV